jgi:UV DNA damage endonuclease
VKIGYPCLNRGIGCSASKTFRLASYSETRFIETVEKNLDCLKKILEYNVREGLFFFRISSDTIPFASHQVCGVNWTGRFALRFQRIGDYIRDNGMRISMHPDQFTLINSPRSEVNERSRAELLYHALLLDAMGLGLDAKIQIHVGGVYGDKMRSIERFVSNYNGLSYQIRKRLVIENDERLYGLRDCMYIHELTGVPILFDVFHHQCIPGAETTAEALTKASGTWTETDGALMVDYSSQRPGEKRGRHTESIDPELFTRFLSESAGFDFDLMLEIKDKEKSARVALDIARNHGRLH